VKLLTILLLLSALGESNLDRFYQNVRYAASLKGVRENTHVVPWAGPNPGIPRAMAWVTYTTTEQPIYVFVRSDVLEKGSPALMKLLAYHEVCHPSLPRGHTEDDADACARRMFFSKDEWARAALEREQWTSRHGEAY
jgi:hypothetical protein